MRKISIVWAEGLNSLELSELREQLDFVRLDPSYTIITKYEIHWTEIELKDDEEVPRLIWGNGLTQEDINTLKEQWDMAQMDPDFFIVTNHKVYVEGIDERVIKPWKLLTRFQILKKEN
jgi:hypothetical protein